MHATVHSLPPDLTVQRLEEADVAIVSGSLVSGATRTVLRTTGREAIALGEKLVREGRAAIVDAQRLSGPDAL